MKKLTPKKSIIIILLITFITSFLIELLVFNSNAILHDSYKESIDVIDYKGFKKENGFYISTSEKSSITLKGNNKYVDKISFYYKAGYNFRWDYIAKDKYSEKTDTNEVTAILNKTTRKIKVKNLKQVKLLFYNKGIKIKDFEVSNKLLINWYRIILMFVCLALSIILIKYFKYFKDNLGKAFLLIGFCFGFINILVTPICLVTSMDDQVHFHRMYILLDGDDSNWTYAERYFNHLVIDYSYKMKTLEEYRDYKKWLNKNDTKKSNIKVENLDSNIDYSELIYLPFSIGYKISKVLGFNLIARICISKLFNLILYLAIMFFAIKISPYCKRLIFFLGLLPTNIYLASQFSYDSTITASLILAFVAFLHILKDKKVEFKYLMIFVLGIIWASLPKCVYCPLLLLLLFIPNKWFENNKQGKLIKIGTIVMFFVLMSIFVLPVLTGTVSGDSRVENTSVSGQLKYILSSPFGYAKLLVRETIINFDKMFFGFDTFSKLGYLTRYNSDYYSFTNFILLFTILYLTFTDGIDKEIINKKITIVLSLILVIIWCLVWTALYLSWTPVGLNHISGVQSRYFLPVLLPLLVLFVPKGTTKNNKFNYLLCIIPVFVLTYSLMLVVFNFYK